MIFHLHRVQVIEQELRHSLDYDRVVSVEKGFLRVNRRYALDVVSGEQVVTHEHISGKDAF